MSFILDILSLSNLWDIRELMSSTKMGEDAWISEGRAESEI